MCVLRARLSVGWAVGTFLCCERAYNTYETMYFDINQDDDEEDEGSITSPHIFKKGLTTPLSLMIIGLCYAWRASSGVRLPGRLSTGRVCGGCVNPCAE